MTIESVGERRVIGMSAHINTRKGEYTFTVRLETQAMVGGDISTFKTCFLFFFFEGDGCPRYAITESRRRWIKMTSVPFPKTAIDAGKVRHELAIPDSIVVNDSGKFPRVLDIIYK